MSSVNVPEKDTRSLLTISQLPLTFNGKKIGYIPKRLISVYEAIEKSKYLWLPYFDVEINERVFLNGDRARILHSPIILP